MAEDCGDVGLSSRSDSDSTTDDVTIAGVDANAGDFTDTENDNGKSTCIVVTSYNDDSLRT